MLSSAVPQPSSIYRMCGHAPLLNMLNNGLSSNTHCQHPCCDVLVTHIQNLKMKYWVLTKAFTFREKTRIQQSSFHRPGDWLDWIFKETTPVCSIIIRLMSLHGVAKLSCDCNGVFLCLSLSSTSLFPSPYIQTCVACDRVQLDPQAVSEPRALPVCRVCLEREEPAASLDPRETE